VAAALEVGPVATVAAATEGEFIAIVAVASEVGIIAIVATATMATMADTTAGRMTSSLLLGKASLAVLSGGMASMEWMGPQEGEGC
jgi:hypothetical protein